MEKKSWKPSVTSQFPICPIPYHMDTYRGCVYNCLYCFARDFVIFARRNSEHKTFSYLIGNRPDLLRNWIERTLNKDYDYKKSHEVAFKERIPIKIGATSDPFPPVEANERVTYDILKVFEEYDYPLEIQTKNPEVLAGYADDFIDPNWVIAVTIISTDQHFIDVIEPRAPTIVNRLEAIKRLTDSGKHVIVKCQPAIYPKILEDLPDLVKAIADSGAFAMNMEGLKIRTRMPESEKKLFAIISDAVGYDLIEYYKTHGVCTGSDWEMRKDKRLEYINLGMELAHQHGIKFFVADNDMGKIGDGDECCGTEVLRNYKKWGNNTRTQAFGCHGICSGNLGSCTIDFVRNQRMLGKTLDEVADEKTKLPEQPEQKQLFD